MAVANKSIGRRIHAARKARGLTQERIAELMRISVAYYGRLERGEKTINLERLTEISQLLQVPMSQLLEDSPAAITHEPRIASPSFLEQMIHYSHHCTDATLRRMLAVCEALAKEDRNL